MPNTEERDMDSLQAWLAAMPVDDVQERIRELEAELELLRVLERQHGQQHPGPRTTLAEKLKGQTAISNAEAAELMQYQSGRPGKRRLSRERRLIIEAIRERPNGLGPHEVGEVLRAQGLSISDNAVQTNMSRMTKTGPPLLLRVEQGRYRLPSHTPAATLLNGSAGGEEG